MFYSFRVLFSFFKKSILVKYSLVSRINSYICPPHVQGSCNLCYTPFSLFSESLLSCSLSCLDITPPRMRFRISLNVLCKILNSLLRNNQNTSYVTTRELCNHNRTANCQKLNFSSWKTILWEFLSVETEAESHTQMEKGYDYIRNTVCAVFHVWFASMFIRWRCISSADRIMDWFCREMNYFYLHFVKYSSHRKCFK